MPLVFAAILPHSPLLVPNIGKKNQELFSATLDACKLVAAELIATQPELVIIISGDETKPDLSFAINLSPRFISDLSSFGDLVTRWQFKGEITAAAQFREYLEGQENIQLITNEDLNYMASIVASLAEVTEAMPLMPVITNTKNLKLNFVFGQHLQKCILSQQKKIAVIASADLSHRLNKKSPAGYLAKAKKLDQKIVSSLTAGKTKELITLSEAILEETAVEDLPTISVLLGIIDGYNWPSRLLSYESPFGVGHAVIGYNF